MFSVFQHVQPQTLKASGYFAGSRFMLKSVVAKTPCLSSAGTAFTVAKVQHSEP